MISKRIAPHTFMSPVRDRYPWVARLWSRHTPWRLQRTDGRAPRALYVRWSVRVAAAHGCNCASLAWRFRGEEAPGALEYAQRTLPIWAEVLISTWPLNAKPRGQKTAKPLTTPPRCKYSTFALEAALEMMPADRLEAICCPPCRHTVHARHRGMKADRLGRSCRRRARQPPRLTACTGGIDAEILRKAVKDGSTSLPGPADRITSRQGPFRIGPPGFVCDRDLASPPWRP